LIVGTIGTGDSTDSGAMSCRGVFMLNAAVRVRCR
jgi:hypothetical protein